MTTSRDALDVSTVRADAIGSGRSIIVIAGRRGSEWLTLDEARRLRDELSRAIDDAIRIQARADNLPAKPARDQLGAFLAAYDDYLDGKIAYRDLPTQIYSADKLQGEIRERYFADAITAERAVELRWLVTLGEWRRRPWWDRLITRLLGGGP